MYQIFYMLFTNNMDCDWWLKKTKKNLTQTFQTNIIENCCHTFRISYAPIPTLHKSYYELDIKYQIREDYI